MIIKDKFGYNTISWKISARRRAGQKTAFVLIIYGGVQVSTGVLKPQKRAAVSQSALKRET